jgi:hypothetical protein
MGIINERVFGGVFTTLSGGNVNTTNALYRVVNNYWKFGGMYKLNPS